MARYYQKGETIDYRNLTPDKIKAGDIVPMGKRAGVAGTDIEPNALGTLHTVGVFIVPKTNSADLFELGADVFFDGTGATSTATEVLMGWAIDESKATSTTVKVKIG